LAHIFCTLLKLFKPQYKPLGRS